MKNKYLLLSALALSSLSVSAQELKEGYIQWGTSSDHFGETLTDWQVGKTVSDDDNFFISRVKPRERFRNTATQVRPDLDDSNDKKLLAWVPINGSSKNALPDGVFDSEVFSLWPYITHWGNWTAPLGRVPGAFLDVAHKNGVGVSSVAGIPYGAISGTPQWITTLEQMTKAGAEKTAQFLRYYGVDGLGYNSEFTGTSSLCKSLQTYHEELVKAARPHNPNFMNVWYDGTNDTGGCTFDRGLAAHNDETFGDGEHERTSLFLNYNWNKASLLSSSVNYAKKINRDPLDLYAGVNMQGAEPGSNSWPLLKDYSISVGLWGAHNENMFWESRGEKGSDPAVKQRTYMLRTERWFTGGTRNPANCPEVTSSMKYNADNFTFHGMSSFMSARSSLKWDLAEEPFISYFNLGNGKFFNWQGERQNNGSWYNIGVQDYLPTWRWWFAKSLLGRTASDVPSEGLDAEFSWDEAYVGGSSLRIFGTTAADEYLHLFKTEYALQTGDVITVRYKLKSGSGNLNLVLTTVGNESAAVDEGAFALTETGQMADEDSWVERQFTVGASLAGKSLAMVALHFKEAKNLDLYLGEFSIVRSAAPVPAKPVIDRSALLAYNNNGVDGKLIFNMPNDKAAGEPCYNIDVNTSLFKLYAQQEGKDPIFMGLTTSWAGMFYAVPLDFAAPSHKVRFGVAAVSLDMKSDSEIAWGEYQQPAGYTYSDDIEISKTTIKPNEGFTMGFIDPKHENATWTLLDSKGNVVFEAEGHTVSVDGLKDLGSYDLRLTGPVYNAAGTERPVTERTFSSFVQISAEGTGALPEIYTLTANGEEADIEVELNENIQLAYTGRDADGAGSQAVDLAEQRFGAKCADLGLVGKKSFSLTFWLKINKLASGETQLVAVANKEDNWPKTDWGWIWTNIKDDGTMGSFTFRGTDATQNNELQYTYGDTRVPIGNWVHVAMTFDWNNSGNFRADYYLNGVKQKVTSWKRTNSGTYTTEPGYEPNVYAITTGQVLSIGGDAFGRNGIDGALDNVVVWDGVLTDAQVQASMGDINASNLPSNVLSYWSLEDKAGSDNTFASVGSKKGVQAGLHSYAAEGGEGQGKFRWLEADYTSGCPFISGTAFPVVTTPTWKASKGIVSNAEGNAKAGSAKVSYSKEGDYSVTLTLANSLGSDSRTFSVIRVGDAVGIDTPSTAATAVYPVDGAAIVEFAEAGNYTVRVYAADGRLVAVRQLQAERGERMQVTLGMSGTYLVDVAKDGQSVRRAKLLNK